MGFLDVFSIGVEFVDIVEFVKGEDVILFVNGKCYVLLFDIVYFMFFEYF